MSVFIQIGTNNGNDNFRKRVLAERPSRVFLVEPNPRLIPAIQQNYANIPNVTIVDKAIYYQDNTTVDLYIAAKNGVYGSMADCGYIFTDVNFSLVPMNNWGSKSDMVKISANTITFNTLCEQHGVTEIDYLQIDTEGFDSEIIRMIDLTKYRIRVIRYEEWGFDPSAFTNHNQDTANRLGKAGMKSTEEKLLAHNYELKPIVDDDGHDIVATLKE